MHNAVQFDDHFLFMAIKIGYISPDRMLATETKTCELLTA